MNRGELVEQIAKSNNVSKRKADTILSSVIETIQKGVKKDGEVRIVNFGTFKKATRKARKGRNPQTGETIKIAKKTFPKFVPSKSWNPTKAVAAKKSTTRKATK